jgi:hypothetical protein
MLGIPGRSSCNPDAHRIRRGARRRSRSSGRKTAHRGLWPSAKTAPRPTRSQVPSVSGKNSHRCTIPRRTPLLPQGNQPQGNQPHDYQVNQVTQCSASSAFDKLKAPGMSAPGAPAAHEGFDPNVVLLGNNGHNRITQTVNSSSMTITNTTLPTHQFYPGSVTFQVAPLPGGGSSIAITGTGTGNDPVLNDVVGLAFFGSVADNVAWQCGSSGTIPNP